MALIQGYHDLLAYQPNGEITRAILKMFHRSVLVFCEAERFRSAQVHVCNVIDNYVSECMPVDTSNRFTSWAALSEIGLAARQREDDQNQIPNEDVPPEAHTLNINNMQQLVGEPNGELLLLLHQDGFGI